MRSLFLPCGQCIGCRLERSRQWAIRCMHEASLYDENCFITLTYDDAHLKCSSLVYADFQMFMRRLRKRFSGSKSGVSTCSGEPSMMRSTGIRFYMCGEYGDNFGRPHFHAILFNFNFPDRKYFKTKNGFRSYRSAVLEELWPFGHSYIGSATFESAAYIARYCVAKSTGKDAYEHYRRVDAETGELEVKVPEFNRMSLKPGIGMPWVRKYFSDVYPNGDVVMRGGKKFKAPRAYDRVFEREQPDEWAALQFRRSQRAVPEENTDSRLSVQEQVLLAKVNLFKRSL